MVLVHMDLNVSEKFWCVLHFVDDNGRSMKLQKQLRIILCHIPHIEIIQRNVTAADTFTLRKHFKHRRFACLPRSRDEQSRKSLAAIQYNFFHVPCDIRHDPFLLRLILGAHKL